MTLQNKPPFQLPDIYLTGLPTGAAKQAVDRMGRMLARGDFEVGKTIPMEAELAEILGVSRTVIRETIKVLSAKGMLRTARRYGTRVLPFDNWNLLDPDVVRWHEPDSPMAARIYRESTEMRRIVEPEAAALAARHATDEQRRTILTAAEAISPTPFGQEAMIAADYTFHATILVATGNIMLAQLQGLILALLQFSYPTGAKIAPEGKVTRQGHIAVAAAILKKDEENARRLMKEMLSLNDAIAKVAEAGRD